MTYREPPDLALAKLERSRHPAIALEALVYFADAIRKSPRARTLDIALHPGPYSRQHVVEAAEDFIEIMAERYNDAVASFSVIDNPAEPAVIIRVHAMLQHEQSTLCGIHRPIYSPQAWLFTHEWDTHIQGQGPRCPDCARILQ